MKIEHIGLWTADLEKMKEFYCDYFKAKAGEKYHMNTALKMYH